jgi:hypothetical protein
VGAYGVDPAVADIELERSYTGVGLDGHKLMSYNLLIVQVFADTADAVSCHFAFAAVTVEDTHFRIGTGRFFNKDNTAATDTVVSVADGNG